MGVAEEVKAARWKGVEPRPTREAIYKAAMVFEARRISDRRRLFDLLKYMNTQRCRVQMMREYFGEPAGELCGLCDSCAGIDSEVFDPGAADQRHDLHAATDFHARKRRRRRGERPTAPGAPAPAPAAPRAPAVVFATAIPEPLPPLPAVAVGAAPESEATFDDGVWLEAPEAGQPLAGEVVLGDDEAAGWLSAVAVGGGEAAAAGPGDDFGVGWSGVRDANIRPYTEWLPSKTISLPAMQSRAPQPQKQQQSKGHHPKQGQGGGGKPNGSHDPRRDRGRRRQRRGRERPQRPGGERGPRLPGMYNPGGD
jgi:hypothetical protein